jgi:hypothetical protein
MVKTSARRHLTISSSRPSGWDLGFAEAPEYRRCVPKARNCEFEVGHARSRESYAGVYSASH